MEFEDKLKKIQETLTAEQIDGWLLYDFRKNNPLAYSFLEIPSGKMLTRRFFYWIPKKGDPLKILSTIEPHVLDHLPGKAYFYRGWSELEQLLFSISSEKKRIAMEYSPCNALPIISKVDAGTIEQIRKSGAEVISSANLLQPYTSIWTEKQLKGHLEAATLLDDIAFKTWAYIEASLQANKTLTEYQVQQFMLQLMEKGGCVTADPPTCAVNAHSADPHYGPKETDSWIIQSGDFILLDLWCKKKEVGAVFADITRVGVAAAHPTEKQQEIFGVVKEARDQATLFIKERYEQKEPIQGWEVDQRCRDVITQAGYEEFFLHRTGHNIGEDVHGPGANLDNLETHDFRELIPGTCFSVEPGIYLPNEFGVRMEYDIYLDPKGSIRITGGIQEELVCLNIRPLT